MLEILSFITGFLGPAIPQVFKWFERKQEYAHELALMDLRLKQGAMEHLWKMEEINANADIAEMKTLRQQQQSFGVQLLDASRAWVEGKVWGAWIVMPVFYLFAFLDFVTGMVRPTVTYFAFGFYMVYKWTLFESLEASTGSRGEAILSTWTEQDWSVLLLILGFYFGQRTMKYVFGGSGNTARAGG